MSLIFKHGYLDALKLSVMLALISTVVCLLLAYPLCLILTEKERDNTTIISLLFILPLWMNSLLSTMAWQTILESNGIINQLMRLLNLPTFNMINTQGAIVVGMVYNFLPYMVLPLFISLSRSRRKFLANFCPRDFAVEFARRSQWHNNGLYSRAHDVRYQCIARRRKTFAHRQYH